MRIVIAVSMLVAGLLGSGAALAHPVDDNVTPIAAPAKHTGMQIARDFRVRADLIEASVPSDPFGKPSKVLIRQFTNSMIDYYPMGGGKGLRVSAGLRFFKVFNFQGDADAASHGLLYGPRAGGAATRTEFNTHTPAVTVGYTANVGRAVLGVEAGSLVGNATATVADSFSRASARRGGGINPIANLVFGLSF